MGRTKRSKGQKPTTAAPPAAPFRDRSGRDRVTLASAAGLALLVLFFLILKAFSVPPHPADEGIYFYGALRMSQGQLPYRDFFFAHPPLQLLALATLFKLGGGFSLLAAKLPTFLGAAAQGPAVWLVVRRLGAGAPDGRGGPGLGSRLAPEAAALVAVAALFFSESFLKASASATGICEASGLLALSGALLVLRRPVAAGIAGGLAVMTLLQAAPALAVTGLCAWALGRRAFARYVASGAAVVVLFHVVFSFASGRAFFDGVYLYHLAKVDNPGEGTRQAGFIIVDNWPLFAGGAVGLLALLVAGGRWRALGLVLGAAVVAQIAFLASRPRVFPFYFQPAFAPLAVLLGLGARHVLAAGAARLEHGAPSVLPRVHAAGVALLAFFLVVGEPLRETISPQRASQRATYEQTYQWMDAPYIGPANRLVRSLFWQDGHRRKGQDPNGITQYLWQRSRWLDSHPTMVEAVRLVAREIPDATLFGDSTTAPLVALQAGLLVTGDFVDTNVERFRSGQVPWADVAGLLDSHPAALLLLAEREGIGTLPEMRAYAETHYDAVARFDATTGADSRHTLYRRRR